MWPVGGKRKCSTVDCAKGAKKCHAPVVSILKNTEFRYCRRVTLNVWYFVNKSVITMC